MRHAKQKLFLFFLVCAGFASAAETINISELIDRYELNLNKTKCFIVQDITTQELTSARTNKTTLRKVLSEFRTDGDRIDCRFAWWSNGRDSNWAYKNDTKSMKMANLRSCIWDGKNSYSYSPHHLTKTPDVIIHQDDSRKDRAVAVLYPGAPLIGILTADLKPVNLILREADKITMREKTENIGGSQCYVINAETSQGKYTVWIDPEHGYNIARAEVEKQQGDLICGKPLQNTPKPSKINVPRLTPLPSEKKGVNSTLRNVRFEEINGVWVPMEADFELNILYENGSVGNTKTHHKRTKIDLNPDFDAVGAFIPDHIPNGTIAYIKGIEGMSYIWQDGKVVDASGQIILDCNERTSEGEDNDAKQ